MLLGVRAGMGAGDPDAPPPAAAAPPPAALRKNSSASVFFAGCVSGIITSTVVQPFDVIKTRMQAEALAVGAPRGAITRCGPPTVDPLFWRGGGRHCAVDLERGAMGPLIDAL